MNFLLHKKTVAFDENGDPLGYYDIVAWDWNGPEWTFEVIGSASLSPVHLDINKTKIQWHGKNDQVMGHGRSPGDCFMSQNLGRDASPEWDAGPTRQATSGLQPCQGFQPHMPSDARLYLSTSDLRLCSGSEPGEQPRRCLFSVPPVSCPQDLGSSV